MQPVEKKIQAEVVRHKSDKGFSRRFERAFAYAARLHTKQFPKGTNRPYIGHLLAVTSMVIQFGGDEDMAIAALLHDEVEDQGGLSRLLEIKRKFGKRVARIVDGCTDACVEPKPPWLERKCEYLKKVAAEPADVQLVSAADKLANARDTLQDVRSEGPRVFERFNGKVEGPLWYYRSIVREFRKAVGKDLVDEHDRVVTALEMFAR
jgi:(p)ppGpp synthase/HD superfamily hydrolase